MEALVINRDVLSIVQCALDEDIGSGDVTSRALIPGDKMVNAEIVTRGACVVSGGGVAEAVFKQVDHSVLVEILTPDSASAAPGDSLLLINGPARAVLTAERTALNLMQRITGIATLTRAYVSRVAGLDVSILDTRKTTPNLRVLEKYAVRCGGGINHRMGLYDMAMIKDNHRMFLGEAGLQSLAEAVRRFRACYPAIPVEVEVESVDELHDALEGEPDWILLDNMAPDRMRTCVTLCQGRCKLEASGGITLDTVRAVAESGVDAISIGALTHSAPAADLSLELRVK